MNLTKFRKQLTCTPSSWNWQQFNKVWRWPEQTSFLHFAYSSVVQSIVRGLNANFTSSERHWVTGSLGQRHSTLHSSDTISGFSGISWFFCSKWESARPAANIFVYWNSLSIQNWQVRLREFTGVPKGEGLGWGFKPPMNPQNFFFELRVCKICCPSSAPVFIKS